MKARFLVFVLLAGLAAAGSPPLQAQSVPWAPFGPGGGAVFALAVDPAAPDTLYAAAGRAGLYKSTDGGASWRWSGNGMAGFNLETVAVDPRRPGAVYTASRSSGDALTSVEKVFQSLDGGVHWRPIFERPLRDFVRMEVAVTAGVVYVSTADHLFKSADRGATWEELDYSGSPIPAALNDVEVDPENPDRVYLSPVAGGLLRSTDGGASWTEVGPQGPADTVFSFGHIAVAPSRPQTLYAVAGFDSHLWLFRSDDGGSTWTAGSPLPELRERIAVDPTDPATVYAFGRGVSVSHDGGETWQTINLGLAEVRGVLSLAVRPDRPSTVYAGTSSEGVYVTRDARLWQPSTEGLRAQAFVWLKVSPAAPSTFYAAAGFHLYRSDDGGATWGVFAAGLNRDFGIRDLVLDRRDPDLLYAVGLGGIYRSRDRGETWARLLAQDAYTLVAVDGRTLLAGTGTGLLRSTDAGRTWKEVLQASLPRSVRLPQRNVFWLKNDPAAPSTIYGRASEYRLVPDQTTTFLIRSTDGGATWQKLRDFYTLGISPRDPNTLYAAYFYDVFRSTNGGRTWTVIYHLDGTTISEVEVDPFDPRTIYLGTNGQGVLVSRDGGATWQPANAGLARQGRQEIHDFSFNPGVPGLVYALPLEGGLYKAEF